MRMGRCGQKIPNAALTCPVGSTWRGLEIMNVVCKGLVSLLGFISVETVVLGLHRADTQPK